MSINYTSADKAFLIKIGKNVRSFRKRANIPQEALADLAELDRSYLGSIERGERNISAMNIRKIAVALKLKPSRLLE